MRTHKQKLFNCSFVRCSADQHQQVRVNKSSCKSIRARTEGLSVLLFFKKRGMGSGNYELI